MSGKPKVVLYNPEAVFFTMPLALMAVGSAVDRERFDVVIIDGRLEDDAVSAVLAQLDDAGAGGTICVGMSVLTGAPIRDALVVSRAVKARYPDVPVVWGGWHPSLFATELLDEASVDISVQGQGEATFVELVERLADGVDLAGLAGICHRVDGKAVRNPPRALIDMQELPTHDYGLMDVERYFQRKGRRQIDYISSTGCAFRCAFCADPFVYKRRWVAISPERVGEEVESLWRQHHFTELAFQDETFFTYRERVLNIADEFIRRGLDIEWTATLRADQGVRLGDEGFAHCVRSGLSRVMIGVESGSQEMMDWMKKDIKVEQVIEAAERCARHGVGAIFPFIVGFPSESAESVRATLAMMKRLRSMSPTFDTPLFYFKPYPGSPITAEVVKSGYQLPQTLEEWAEFDFIGTSSDWVSPEKERLIERFKFYNRFAGGPERWFKWPLQQVSRWRCRHDAYRLPVEKFLVERLYPSPKLS